MKIVKFKTNIKCGGCISTVTPYLDKLENIDSWKVDIDNPDKILEVTIKDDNTVIIIESIREAGYTIEEIYS